MLLIVNSHFSKSCFEQRKDNFRHASYTSAACVPDAGGLFHDICVGFMSLSLVNSNIICLRKKCKLSIQFLERMRLCIGFSC